MKYLFLVFLCCTSLQSIYCQKSTTTKASSTAKEEDDDDDDDDDDSTTTTLPAKTLAADSLIPSKDVPVPSEPTLKENPASSPVIEAPVPKEMIKKETTDVPKIQEKSEDDEDGGDEAEEDSSYFKTGISYYSDNAYNGRVDSIQLPYIMPLAGYYHKSGLWATASLLYSLASAEKKFEYVSFDIGYDHDISDNLSFGVYADRSFYNSSSSLMRSSIKGWLGGKVDYDFGIVNLTLESSVLFGDKLDYTFNPALSREVKFKEKSPFVVTPMLLANFSTLNYYNSYGSSNFKRKNKKGPNSLLTIDNATTVDNPKLQFMDVEISSQAEYTIGKMTLYLNPTLALPTNKINTTTVYTTYNKNGVQVGKTKSENSTESSELKFTPIFIAEFGVYFKF